MLQLDFETLSFAASVAALVAGIALAFLYLGHRREGPLLLFAAGALVASAGLSLFWMAEPYRHPGVLVAALALLLEAHALFLWGARRFYERGFRPLRSHMAMAGAVAALTIAAYAPHSPLYASLVFKLFLVALALLIAWEFLRRGPDSGVYEAWPGPRLLAGGMFVLHAVWHLGLGLLDVSAAALTEGQVYGSYLVRSLGMLNAGLMALFGPFAVALLTGQKLQRNLDRLARIDPLTEVSNRRAFEERLVAELSRAERDGSEISLLMMDLDDFKAVNDTFGHGCGDRVLCAVTAAISGSLRQADVVGRIGGDEIGVLLPATTLQAGMRVGQRILQAIRRVEVACSARTVQVTASAGLVCCPPNNADMEAIFRDADARLYAAKAAGRDRLSWHADTAGPGRDNLRVIDRSASASD